MHHEQDMRHMGGLAKHIRFTWAMMLIGTIAITGLGIPLIGIGFSGFYSKDMIIESAFAAHTGIGNYAFMIGVLAAAMTSFYSWRLMFMTFHGEHRGTPHHDGHHGHDHDHHHAHAIHESPLLMLVPLGVLAIGAVFAGPLFYGLFVGEAAHGFWHETLALHGGEHHEFPLWVVFAPLVASLIGLYIAYYYYIRHPELPPKMAAKRGMLYLFLYNKWYFDELYDFIFVRPAKALGRILWKVGDGKIIDGLGPDGISARVLDVTRGAVRLQSGYVYHYAFAMLIGAAALVTWFLFHPAGN
jgi:NADH-quinone oxidoreductase subunit L